MKYLIVLCFFALTSCGTDRIETITGLLTEQKRLKDSANHLHDNIGIYLQKGNYDSASIQKIQLGAVHARLTAIQASIDSRSK